MPEKPTPLREALQKAVEELIDAAGAYARNQTTRSADALTQAERKAALLIQQIPIVFEAREGE